MAVTIFKCFMQIIPNPYNNTKKIDFVSSILELRKVSSVSASDFPRLYSEQPQGLESEPAVVCRSSRLLSVYWTPAHTCFPASSLCVWPATRHFHLEVMAVPQPQLIFPPAPSWWCDHLFSHPGHHLRAWSWLCLSPWPLWLLSIQLSLQAVISPSLMSWEFISHIVHCYFPSSDSVHLSPELLSSSLYLALLLQSVLHRIPECSPPLQIWVSRCLR